MIRRSYNILLSILFSITLFITVFCLSFLNSRFVIKVMDKTNYCENLYEEVNNQYNDLNKEMFIKDIKKYVKSNYDNKYIKYNSKERDLYNHHIKFNDRFEQYDLKLIRMLIFIVDLVLIIGTGIIFTKTKGKHSLTFIIIFNFIFSVIVYGMFKIFVNFKFDLLMNVFNSFNRLYIAVSIILLEFVIFKYIKKKYLT